MRKQNPNDVIDAFQRELDESVDLWKRLRAEVGETGELAKQVSLDAFQRAAVAFETFRSDWHIAAINRDSGQFKEELTRRVEQSVTGRWKGLAGRVAVDLPKHPSLEVVRTLFDPDGENVSLGSSTIWTQRANDHLRPAYRDAVENLPNEDRLLIDAVISIRNLLSHHSQKSSNDMNVALRNLHGHHDRDLRRGTNRIEPSGIRNYLNANQRGKRRAEIFHCRLKEVAERSASQLPSSLSRAR
ncbi:MAG: hypothetical protein ACRDM7_00160 [Thermoleophilaceae bacterium]